ncbi:MAG: hypothetical protein ICV77_12170 [Cyanobacteria bacterium Co-bin8]|nr:hypothetical protein [Cyanobacteria bacterium Co-bin8]
MVATPSQQATEVIYPGSDRAPLAETSVHINAIVNAVVALRQYLEGQQAEQRAEQERQRAETAEARMRELEEKLRSHGIDPNAP